MTDVQFKDLGLSKPLLDALDAIGYQHPTPVQEAAIPVAATGRDIMAQAQTGTGKTAAFSIPLIDRLEDAEGVSALILCPTRELAKQVADEISRLAQFKRLTPAAVYGGASMDKQIREIRQAQIVVGTPGRVLDHLKRGNLDLRGLEALVLDEADEMLSMGFARELDQIMSFLPKKHQTLLFSATIPAAIKRYAQRYMEDPEYISTIVENVGAENVEHHYYMVSGMARARDLVHVLQVEEPESALIFANTRKDTEMVARYMKKSGLQAEYLNSDLPQRERERVMRLSKDKSLRYLVATDIAARGIDISKLSHVINYTLPESPEVYIHRTGRTGRAGSRGTAISLVAPQEIGVYYYLKKSYNVPLQERTVPKKSEIAALRKKRQDEGLETEINGLIERLNKVDASAVKADIVERLMGQENAQELVASLLAAFLAGPQASKTNPLEDVPKPAHVNPGGVPQTIEDIASRVAVMRGEFRGLPEAPEADAPEADAPEADAPAKEADAPAKEAADEKPRRGRRPKKESAAPVEESSEDGGRGRERRPKRSRTSAKSSEEGADTATEPKEEKPAPPPRPQLGPGECRIFVNVGRRDSVDESGLREAIAELGGLLPDDIIDVDVCGRYSFLTIDDEFADDVLEAVNGEQIGRRTLRLERAKER